MSEFIKYRKKGIAELRPYIVGEDLTMISISQEDNPKEGDMISRNPKNHEDLWLVDKDYFERHFEPIDQVLHNKKEVIDPVTIDVDSSCFGKLVKDTIVVSKSLFNELITNDKLNISEEEKL